MNRRRPNSVAPQRHYGRSDNAPSSTNPAAHWKPFWRAAIAHWQDRRASLVPAIRPSAAGITTSAPVAPERFGLGNGNVVVRTHAGGIACAWPKMQGTGNRPRSSACCPVTVPGNPRSWPASALIIARQTTPVGDNKSRNCDEIDVQTTKPWPLTIHGLLQRDTVPYFGSNYERCQQCL